MRTKKEVEKALKEELEDLKLCQWHQPCASCFEVEVTAHVLKWVLGKRKKLIGVEKSKLESN